MNEIEQLKQQVVLNAKCIQGLRQENKNLYNTIEVLTKETQEIIKNMSDELENLHRLHRRSRLG